MTHDPVRIVLCADDYAISPGVSRGIVELARLGRLSATSAMSVAPHWPLWAGELAAAGEALEVGLHLTLTAFAPLAPMPALAPGGRLPRLSNLVQAAVRGRLPRDEIAAEIHRQLDAFTAHRGRLPDFVDGHQHVHALPGIRDVLLEVLTRRGCAGQVWLRDPSDHAAAILRRKVSAPKALLVAALSRGFAGAARRAGFTLNRGFSGFSAFGATGDVAADFARYLMAPGPAHLVMCHPGHVDPGDRLDGVVESRTRELGFLASDRFPALLRANGMELAGHGWSARG